MSLSSKKPIQVTSVCNALVDILVEATDADLKQFNLNKGVMHLVSSSEQKKVLDHFATRKTTIELGGSSMNAIRAIAALGQKTGFAGIVGHDAFGTQIRARVKELGINAVIGDSKVDATGACFVLITPDGERTMVTSLGASRHYDTSHVPEDLIRQSNVFHFSAYQWDTDNQKIAIKHAIATAKEADTLLSLDVADPFVVGRYGDDLRRLIEDDADIVFANKEESRLLYNATPEVAADKIAATGAIAVMKLGAEGALIARGSERHHIKPVATKLVDTTAAGDMFAGGFLYGFTTGKDLAKAGMLGAMLASDVISRIGATLSSEALARAKAI